METKNDLDVLRLLLPAVIFGAEGENEGEGDNDNPSGDEDENAGSGSDNDDPEDGEHDDANDPKVKGLKAALAAERRKNAALEKKQKQADKAKADAELAEKSELEQAQTKAQQAEERAQKLANGFLQSNINAAIRSAARDLNFIDVDDALAGVERSGITYDQDSDDPSDVSVDEDTVIAAVKALAKKKPHFLKTGTDDGDPTGSPMGGSRKKKLSSDEELAKKYPALR